jgi:hypothetical protein
MTTENQINNVQSAQYDDNDWRNYFFFADFTPHYELLNKMPLGPLSEENQFLLASIVSEIDTGIGKGLWMDISPSREWGMQGVEIIYNDKNAMRLPTRNRPGFAMGLSFPTDSVAPKGVVYITYAKPEGFVDPEPETKPEEDVS